MKYDSCSAFLGDNRDVCKSEHKYLCPTENFESTNRKSFSMCTKFYELKVDEKLKYNVFFMYINVSLS